MPPPTAPKLPAPELTAALRQRAHQLGFTLAGACPAVAPLGASRLDEWLARGYAGEMHYIAERKDAYADPRHVLDGARSILMLALPYAGASDASQDNIEPGQGRVASYAHGDADYHDVIRARLHNLADHLRALVPTATTRGIVDTAPLLEREFAQLASLGWVGKNTLLLNRTAGSYFFIAALLTDQLLEYDAPHTADHCGTCTACLDACPTQAFPEPHVLDASRCISYLTIEHRSEIPLDLRAGMGDWLFGCDICQQVCPWNHHAKKNNEASRVVPDPGARKTPLPRRDGSKRARSPVATERSAVVSAENDKPASLSPSLPIPLPRREGPGEGFPTVTSSHCSAAPTAPDSSSLPATPPLATLDLIPLFALTEADFRTRFRHTPLWRPHRRGLLRNAAIVLGNQRHGAAIPALTQGLNDSEPLVREACAWALAQIKGAPCPATA